MENITGNIVFIFIITFVLFYIVQIALMSKFRESLWSAASMYYNNSIYCDDIEFVWISKFKETVDGCYKFLVARTFIFSVYISVVNGYDFNAHNAVKIVVGIIIVFWLLAEGFWAKFKADQAAKAVWETLSE